jgi:hypothetical protein
VGAIKYKTPKPVAHAARAPQVLALFFNYAHLLRLVIKFRGRNRFSILIVASNIVEI